MLDGLMPGCSLLTSLHPSCPPHSSTPGKWVLATTRNYLMVLKTTYKDPKTGKELCGFTSRMGANAPAPRLLRLKTGRWAGRRAGKGPFPGQKAARLP